MGFIQLLSYIVPIMQPFPLPALIALRFVSFSAKSKLAKVHRVSSFTCRLMMSASQLVISSMMPFFRYSQLRAQDGQ